MARAQRRLERVFKGAANHRRIEMLQLLERLPDLTLSELERHVGVDHRTASEHTRKLVLAGLLWKRYEGRYVRHRVSDRGAKVLKFCRELD